MTDRRLSLLPADRADEAVAVLVDAFHDYPVMRHVVGEAGADYDRRLNMLIGVFVARRVDHAHPIVAIEEDGDAVGVATLTLPGDPGPPSAAFEARVDALWQDLGQDTKARMERLVEVWKRLSVPGPQFHLNMLGVRRAHAGRGAGRLLLDEVHRISREHPESTGVSLSTEDPKNVLLYEHCGYEVRFHERVSPGLETWILFRPDDR
ncbi:MAG TPA: GNAT family N-acetyltransferase [Candidatus Eisenbacteria bacterium]|jgi:GNAT superfamily N-acetyltransferase|nr:GNAT family N-acetyltransferase [Candidatus Eisenbacteria bacterium]